MMNTNDKNSYLQIRIDADTKKQFKEICQKRAVNSSALLRQWIENYIAENQSVNTKIRL